MLQMNNRVAYQAHTKAKAAKNKMLTITLISVKRLDSHSTLKNVHAFQHLRAPALCWHMKLGAYVWSFGNEVQYFVGKILTIRDDIP